MQVNKELEELKDITGVEESVCACKECVAQCKSAPCLGTPTDILNLVRAGYAGFIVYTKWVAGVKQNIPPITLIAPYFDLERGCCTFLDAAQKNCTLHDLGLKPTGGRLQHHSLCELGVKLGVNLPVDHAVALTWKDNDNALVMMEILSELREYKAKNPETKNEQP